MELKGKMRSWGTQGREDVQGRRREVLPEYQVITYGERSPNMSKVLDSCFEFTCSLSSATSTVRNHARLGSGISHPSHDIAHGKKTGEPKRPARSTLHQEIVALRHVLKTANRHGWLPYLPDLSAPIQNVRQNRSSGMVLARRIQAALRSDSRKGQESEEPTLEEGVRELARLRSLHGQHRLEAGRGRPPRISRRRHRYR